MRRALSLALLAALLLGFGFYLQRPDAFTRVWLPLARALSGASLQASSGRLTWSGRLQAHDLRYRDDALSATAARLALHVKPLSLLPGRALVFHRIEASDAEIVASADAAAPELEATPGDAAGVFVLPHIARAKLEEATLRIVQEDGLLSIGPGRLTAADVGSGRGRAELHAPLERVAGEETPLRGQLDVSLDFAPATETPPPYRVDALSVKLADSDGTLARVSLGGRFGGPGDFSLEGDVASERPDALLALAGLEPENGLRIGTLRGTLAAKREDAETLTLRCDLALYELVSEEPGEALPSTLEVDAELQLSEGRLALERVAMTPLDPGGAPRGTLHASGHLDVGSGSGSEIVLTADELVVAPWLRIAELPVPEAGPLPASGELRWEHDGAGSALEGELRTRLTTAPDAAETPLVLRPTLQFGDPAVSGSVEVEGPGTGSGGAGRASLELSVDDAAAPPAVRLAAELRSFDLTPFRPLWSGEEGEPDGPAASQSDEANGFELAAEIRADAVRLDPLVVEEGVLHLERGPDRLALRLGPTRLAGGSASFDYARRTTVESEQVELALSAESVSLPALLGALGLEANARYEGRLSLDGGVTGRAPLGEDPLESAAGQLRFEIGDASAEDTKLQQLVAAETALEEFLGIRIGSTGGEYPVEDGRLVIDELRLDGRAVHLVVTGGIGIDGLELRVNPRVGPDLASKLPTHLVQKAAGTVLGQLALPLVVIIEGSYGAVSFRSRPALPSLLGSLYGGITGFARWVAPGPNGGEDPSAPLP